MAAFVEARDAVSRNVQSNKYTACPTLTRVSQWKLLLPPPSKYFEEKIIKTTNYGALPAMMLSGKIESNAPINILRRWGLKAGLSLGRAFARFER